MPYYVDVRYINGVNRAVIAEFKGLSCLHASLLIPTDRFLRYQGDWKVVQIIKELDDSKKEPKLIVHVYLNKITSSDVWYLR